MWMLVLIMIDQNVPEAYDLGTFDSMNDCFDERQITWEYKLPEDKNKLQLICVRNEDY